MKKQRILISVLLTISLLLTNVVTALAMPPLPSSFYGTVKVNGANVALGTPISAWINGVKYAETSAILYNGDTVYSLNVAGDDGSTTKIEGGVEGDTISYHIGDLVAAETGAWHSGTNIERNLTAHLNTPPVITEGASIDVDMSEDSSPTPFSQTLHATDVDGDTLTWGVSTPAGNGTASASGTGTSKAIGYTPNANYNGADTFTVQVSDGNGGIDAITVNVTIAAVNDAPVANAQSVMTSKDTPKDVTLSGSDVESSPLAFAIAAYPAHGALTGTAPDVTYTPNAGYTGPDSFTFKVNDGELDSVPATVSIVVTPYECALSITATGSGSVSKDPDQTIYFYGDIVQLTAVPEPGWRFDHWAGSLSGSANPASIVMDGDTAITAVFVQNEYAMDIKVVGYGSVEITPDSPVLHYGDIVHIVALPDFGSFFAGWSGDVNGNNEEMAITVTKDLQITATFAQGRLFLPMIIH